MAQRTIITTTCDIDEDEASDTIELALEGAQYEIDLCPDHAEELREVMEPFVMAARPLGGRHKAHRSNIRSLPSINGRIRPRPDKAQLTAIREWARSKGHAVSDRGRIAVAIVDAYHAEV